MAEEFVKKPKLEEDDKAELGQRLGMIMARYPTPRKLREADVNITITVFVGKTKSSTTGTLVDVTGKIENIDFTMSRVVVDGKKYKLSEIVHMELPVGFESDTDGGDYGESGSFDEYSTRQLSPCEIAERQRQIEQYREQQRRDYERQMREAQERTQRRWEMAERDRNRRAGDNQDYSYQHGLSSDYVDEPFRDYPDEPFSDFTDYPGDMYRDYIPDDSAYIDAPAPSEKVRDENDDNEERSSSKKSKKDNWRLAYLPPKKKSEPSKGSKKRKTA